MKILSKIIYLILISIFFISCNKKYNRTVTVCDGNLFVEVFKHPFIDIAYDYLTDSSNFRLYVGKFDYEHAYYRYNCENDYLVISENYEGEIINFRKYSIDSLRMRNDFYR